MIKTRFGQRIRLRHEMPGPKDSGTKRTSLHRTKNCRVGFNINGGGEDAIIQRITCRQNLIRKNKIC
ncbi:hypothetical protein RchiOBHm_Chr7g0183951 [Rosa chinensis]|uniref:Uncharacterized protein n=1 Tax=Rosa chinensis TaxID=74649 RepID=A0A2P6P394_ROSCH|nr:hypothetical protein RchiOBHm_Chr7g0183951 [Rosa chinensis]